MSSLALPLEPAWLDSQRPREGRYLLGPLLGQGGMGEVREAWDLVLRRTVALKVLRAMDSESLIRFMHEAQLQARVIHPNICRIYDVESTAGAPRIAMQLISGPTLADHADRLSVAELIPLFAQVAEAVHAAHKHQLIHRDLKPSNILLEPASGIGWVPYVCDFGLAMALDEPALTHSQGIKGTPAYMAPEQIRGDRHLVGPATDVYSLGGALFFALYGQLPNGSCLNPEALLGRRGRPRPLPPCPKPGLSAGLQVILRKCLEPDPMLRFQSMADLAEDLWRLHRGQPIQTRATTWLDRHLPLLRQHPKAALATFLGSAALVLALVGTQQRLNKNTAQRAEWTRMFALEAAELENAIRVEKMLPVHDLRPAYSRLRQRMDTIRARMNSLGPDAQGPGRYALGRGRFLMHDYAGAQVDLEWAWSLGYRGPEVAYLLARALVRTSEQAENQSLYATGLAPANSASAAHRVETLFRQGCGLDTDPDDFARALIAFHQDDYTQAASLAHASLSGHPAHYDSAVIEATSRCALGRQQYDSGDLAGAETSYREAMAAAGQSLAVSQSDEGVHHAYLQAGYSLAYLEWLSGSLASAVLPDLERRCQAALKLNPDNPELQSDWLLLALLKAAVHTERGQDPGPTLNAALGYLQNQVLQPLTPELRADRMMLHWGLAVRQYNQGKDPSSELSLAFKDAGHTPFLHRDFLADLTNFKARVEASWNQDPRATVATTLAGLQPMLEANPSWHLAEQAAEAWLIRGQWETGHGLAAGPSLDQARTLARRAQQGNPASPAGYALEGLVWIEQRRLQPDQGQLMTNLAQERLEASLARGPAPRLQARLREYVQAAVTGRPDSPWPLRRAGPAPETPGAY